MTAKADTSSGTLYLMQEKVVWMLKAQAAKAPLRGRRRRRIGEDSDRSGNLTDNMATLEVEGEQLTYLS